MTISPIACNFECMTPSMFNIPDSSGLAPLQLPEAFFQARDLPGKKPSSDLVERFEAIMRESTDEDDSREAASEASPRRNFSSMANPGLDSKGAFIPEESAAHDEAFAAESKRPREEAVFFDSAIPFSANVERRHLPEAEGRVIAAKVEKPNIAAGVEKPFAADVEIESPAITARVEKPASVDIQMRSVPGVEREAFPGIEKEVTDAEIEKPRIGAGIERHVIAAGVERPVAVAEFESTVAIEVEKPSAADTEVASLAIAADVEKPGIGARVERQVSAAGVERPVISPGVEKPVAVARGEWQFAADVEIASPAIAADVEKQAAISKVETASRPPEKESIYDIESSRQKHDGFKREIAESIIPALQTPSNQIFDSSIGASANIDISSQSPRVAEMVDKVVLALVESIADEISVTPHLVKGDKEVHIILKPNVLDGSEITLSAKEGSLTCTITPSNSEVGELMNSAVARLEAALAEHVGVFRSFHVVLKKGKAHEAV